MEIQTINIILFLFTFRLYQNVIALQTFGPNLITNPIFSQPQLGQGINMTAFPLSVNGWNCINYCYYQSIPLICQNLHLGCNLNYSQGMDLNSLCLFENVSQTVAIDAKGSYLLHIEWIIPLVNPLNKTFGIYVNQVLVSNITVTTSVYNQNVIQVILDIEAGNLLISMMMLGVRTDCWGVVIANVELRKVIPIIQSMTSFQKGLQLVVGEDNIVMSFLNKISGNRIFLNVLMGQYRMIDRIQFYYYHKQNFTQYSEATLSVVNGFMHKKSSMFQQIMESCNNTNNFCLNVNQAYMFLFNSLNQKYEYSDSNFLSKNSNGIGFFANNLDFLFYQITGVILFQIIISLLFRALFNYPVSIYLRLYSFYGAIFFIIFEGNVQQFAFYFFAECKLLFSSNMTHKLGNVFLILLFLLMIFFIVGGLLWFRFHYRRRVKYFIQDFTKATLITLFYQSMEKSFFPLIFGSIHILCIDNLMIQTIFLTITELFYLVVRILVSKSIFPKQKIKIVITVVASFLRIVLIITLFFFEGYQNFTFINQIHFVIIVLYLINGIFEFLTNVTYFSAQFKDKWNFGKQKIQSSDRQSQQQQQLSYRKDSQIYKISIKINGVDQRSDNNIAIRHSGQRGQTKDTLFYYLNKNDINQTFNDNWRKIIQKSCKNLPKVKKIPQEKPQALTHRFLMLSQMKTERKECIFKR